MFSPFHLVSNDTEIAKKNFNSLGNFPIFALYLLSVAQAGGRPQEEV